MPSLTLGPMNRTHQVRCLAAWFGPGFLEGLIGIGPGFLGRLLQDVQGGSGFWKGWSSGLVLEGIK